MNFMPDRQFIDMLDGLARYQIPCKTGHRLTGRQYKIISMLAHAALIELRNGGSVSHFAIYEKWVREVMPTMLAPGDGKVNPGATWVGGS